MLEDFPISTSLMTNDNEIVRRDPKSPWC